MECQIEETSFKYDRIWVEEEEIAFICQYLNNPYFGICHGVRTGQEILWFHKYTKAKVIGTEISPFAATQCKDTIVWDFHNVKPEWIHKADFIYSNSLDHSYNPKGCLKSWISCLSSKGVAFIQWNEAMEQKADKSDCANISYDDMMALCKPYLKKVLSKKLRLKYHWFVLSPQISFF